MDSTEQKDETPVEDSQDYESGGWKFWLQDNLRILISVLIVIIIAGGIYSYSKRSEAPIAEEQQEQENILEQIAGIEDSQTEDDSAIVTEEQEKVTPEPKKEDQTSSIATSQETDSSFVETAVRGDSYTTLGRRALANYLEKNPDSTLTAEHKIYIEDYLRKHIPNRGKVFVGTSVEFSKNLIQEAISNSKNLNERQIQNLHKYAVRVPSLS